MFRLIMIAGLCLGLMACGGDKGDAPESYRVTAVSVEGGHLVINDSDVFKGHSTWARVIPDAHYKVLSVKGCSGKLEPDFYVTGSILADCAITAVFTPETFKVSVATVPGGNATPALQEIPYNSFAKVSISPDEGYSIKSVSGCGGTLTGKTYTTEAITSACIIVPAFEPTPPATSIALNGIAAEGAALSNAAVTAKCADGSGFLSHVTTDAQGNFSGQLTPTALPCALTVTDSRSGSVYYSLATETGRVNITPLTSLVLALASQQSGKDWLADGDWQSAAAQLPVAQALVKQALIAAGYHLPESAFLPLTAQFNVGDDWDKVLDQLQLAIHSNQNIGTFDALVNLIKDGNLSSLPALK